MATNVNNRITSTKQVWIVVHEDHYFKHLFYDMSIKCSYIDSKMVGVKITFHDQYQNEAHELNIDTASRDVFDKRIELSVCTILDSIDWIIKSKEFNGNPTIINGTRFHSIKEIMRMASEIAATDSVEPEREAKLKRFEHLGGFDTKEILYIKAKTSDFDNNLVIDNRDDEYKARQKTSFGSEAKAKEILGVNELQDSLTKARSIGPDNKQLLDIKDLTLTGKEDFVDENMPNCIRYPILEALRKIDMHCCNIQPISLFQAGIQQINSTLGKAVTENRPQAFIYNAILELCDIVRPKDLIVYKWSNGLIVIQIGSWLVNAEYNSGIVVFGDDHKQCKLELLLTRYLSDKALRWDKFYKVELPGREGNFMPVFNKDNEASETITLEIMTGTEFICKCGKPKDIKMCFAVDAS